MRPKSPGKAAEPKKEKISFWLTAPGILTGIASVIGAVTGLIVALGQSGIISSSDPPVQPPESKPVPERIVDLEGEVLSMEVPEWWIENPVRGSIDFSNHDQIEETKSVLVGLSVRSEGENPKWETRDPWHSVATLREGEHLCDVSGATNNGSHFYLGLQAHCKNLDICVYGIEGSKLRVTIKRATLIIKRDCSN
jgi:hypothetical protein